MASSTGKVHCIMCKKEKAAYLCQGCSQTFCISHLLEHRQKLDQELHEVEHEQSLFRQTLAEQTTNPQKHSLIQQITQWEQDSINKVKQIADEARESLMKHTNQHIDKIQIKLTKVTEKLKQIREENDFNEIDLNELKQKLKELEKELVKPPNISIRQDSSPYIKKISVIISSDIPYININSEWIQNGTTIAGDHRRGNGLNQLDKPLSMFIDDDQTICVADFENHRIVEWKSGVTNGQVVAGGYGSGNGNDQMTYPTNVIVDKESDCLIISDLGNSRVVRWPRRNSRSGATIISNVNCYGLAMDNDGYLYVSDHNKHEVRRWKIGDTNGTVVAGGNGQGVHLNQLNSPVNIFIDQDHSVYVSDNKNHRVMKWMKGAKEGIVVAGGHGVGNGLTQLLYPKGIIVDQLGTVYVADLDNHRVMRWLKEATQGSVLVGGNGKGTQPNQLNYPVDLSFDRQNNIYVLDNNNHRVQKFAINLN